MVYCIMPHGSCLPGTSVVSLSLQSSLPHKCPLASQAAHSGVKSTPLGTCARRRPQCHTLVIMTSKQDVMAAGDAFHQAHASLGCINAALPLTRKQARAEMQGVPRYPARCSCVPGGSRGQGMGR